jgi:hypothetical protein
MTATEFAKIASALAWPLTTFILVVLFYSPLTNLLERLTTTLRIKTIKLKAFGTEVELTPEEVKTAMNELLQEISDPTNELKANEILLFESVVASDGRKSVSELVPSFARGNEFHDTLRRLRDRHLIRPIEGSRWLPEKHPIATRFGKLVNDLKEKRHAKTDA